MTPTEKEREEAIKDAKRCIKFYEDDTDYGPMTTCWDLDTAKMFISEVTRLEAAQAEIQRLKQTLKDIVKKVPEKVSVYEAADMAIEFKQAAQKALMEALEK